MSRYGRGIDPLRGSGVSRTIATPGVTATTVYPDRTAADLLGVVGSGMQAAASTVDFLAGAEQIRIQRERADRIAAERAQAEFERANAQTEDLQRGEAIDAARLRATTLQGEVQRGETLLPDTADAEAIQNAAILFSEDEASRLFPDSPVARDAYASAIAPIYAREVVDQFGAVAKEERAFAVRRYVSAGPDSLDEAERNLFPGQRDKATLELYLPMAETLAKAGDVAGVDRLSPRLQEVFGPELQRLRGIADEVQKQRQSESIAASVTDAALATSEALTSGRIEDILLQRERLRDGMKSNPTLATYFDGPIATLNNAADRYFGDQERAAVEARRSAATQATMSTAWALSNAQGLGSIIVDGGIPVRDPLTGEEFTKIPEEQATRQLSQMARVAFADPANRQPGETQIQAVARYHQKNGIPMQQENSLLRISAANLKSAAVDPDNPKHAGALQQAEASFGLFNELRTAGLDGVLEFNGDMAVYVNANSILESNRLAGQQMTPREALLAAARGAASPLSLNQQQESLLQSKAASITDPFWLFNKMEGKSMAQADLMEYARVLKMRNPSMDVGDALNSAQEIIKQNRRNINGHYTLFRDGVPATGFGDDYTVEDGAKEIIADIAARVGNDPAFAWNNEPLQAKHVRLYQDPHTRYFLLQDSRTGETLRYTDDNGASVTATFSKDEFVSALKKNASDKYLESRRNTDPFRFLTASPQLQNIR